MGAHAEHIHLLLRGLVQLTELLRKLVARDVRASRVNHIQVHLLALEQTVRDELAGPERNRRVRVLRYVSKPFS